MRKQKCGFQWMRVGFASASFRIAFSLVCLAGLIASANWVYGELAETGWRLVHFLAVYLLAALAYANLGVWLHEQLHCLAFRGTEYERRTHIIYERKYLLVLSGHYQVSGGMDHGRLVRALLGPLILTAGLLIMGWLGSYFLPGWWMPLMLTLVIVSVMDMIHDLYWITQIWRLGSQGRYWDNGRALDVVWKAGHDAEHMHG